MQSKERLIHHEILGKPWKVVDVDMFSLYNRNYLCIVDNHSKFKIVMKTDVLLAHSLVLACKVILAEHELSKK